MILRVLKNIWLSVLNIAAEYFDAEFGDLEQKPKPPKKVKWLSQFFDLVFF